MAQGILPIDLQVKNFACTSFKGPPGFVSNDGVASGAAIDAAKLIHVTNFKHQQDQTAAVVAKSEYAYIVHGSSCTVAGVTAMVDTVATGADRTVSVDLQRSTAGGAFSSILTTPLVLNNSNVARMPVSAALSVTSLTQNDVLKWVVTVAGAAGSQASGFIAEATLFEAAT